MNKSNIHNQPDAAEVARIAKLAKLELPPEKLENLTSQLGEILLYVDTLNSVDTAGVEPMTMPAVSVDTLADDELAASRSRDEMLSLAPDQADGLYKVPKVLGEGA